MKTNDNNYPIHPYSILWIHFEQKTFYTFGKNTFMGSIYPIAAAAHWRSLTISCQSINTYFASSRQKSAAKTQLPPFKYFYISLIKIFFNCPELPYTNWPVTALKTYVGTKRQRAGERATLMASKILLISFLDKSSWE